MKRSLLLAFLILCAQSALAATFFVSTDGNDANPGTIGSPFLTIQHAALNPALACGDTINIRGGTYNGGWALIVGNFTVCSSWGSSITVQPYMGESVVITSGADCVMCFQATFPAAATPIYWQFHDLICDGVQAPSHSSSCVVSSAVDFVRMNSLEIKNFQSTGMFIDNNSELYDMDGWELTNLNVHDTGLAGNDVGGAQPHGIYLTHMTNCVVDGGLYHDNFGYGIQINSTFCTVKNTRIYNNNLPNTGNGGMNIGNGQGNLVYNNLLWNNLAFALQLNSSCYQCAAYNNTAYANTTGIGTIGTVSSVIKNNISFGNTNNISDLGTGSVIANNVVTDPTFQSTNSAAANYLKIQSTSAAINAGENLTGLGIGALDTDLAGNGRPASAPWDAGAYQASEFTPTAQLLSVSPTSGVQGAAPSVTMTGSLTAFDGTSTVTFSGSGITASSYSAVDNTHLSATFTITGGAATGARDVTVHTTGNSDVTKSGGFTVTAAAVPSVASVTPSQCLQGQVNVSVAVVGTATNFVNGTTALTAMAGITTNSVTVSNSTHLTLSLTCAGGATPGTRDVILVTGAETTTGGNGAFNVIQAAACAPPNLTDASGVVPGQCVASPPDDGSGTITEVTANLPANASTLAGSYLVAGHVVGCKPSGCVGGTEDTPLTAVTDSLGNTYAKCSADLTNETAQLEIWVAPSTHAGKPAATFAHGGSRIYYSPGFLTEFYGLVSSSPCDVSGTASGTSTTPSITTSGNTAVAKEVIYALVTSGSSSVVENSPCTLIQALTNNALEYKLSGSAGSTQTCAFTTANQHWVGSIIGLKPNNPVAVITVCVPTFGVTGAASFSLSCTGSGTHWDGTTVPSFSNMGGITVSSTNVTSATTVTFVFDISLGALIGPRDVIMTTGTEVASLTNGFTINFSGTISRGAGRMKFR